MTQYSKGIKTTKIKNSQDERRGEEEVRGNHGCSRQTLAQTHTRTRCWFVWFFSLLVFQKNNKKWPQHVGKIVGRMSLVILVILE